MGEKRNAYRLFGGKIRWKNPLGRPRCRWTVLNGALIGWGSKDWLRIQTSGGHFVTMVMNLWVP
jgi:hypothetical protein